MNAFRKSNEKNMLVCDKNAGTWRKKTRPDFILLLFSIRISCDRHFVFMFTQLSTFGQLVFRNLSVYFLPWRPVASSFPFDNVLPYLVSALFIMHIRHRFFKKNCNLWESVNNIKKRHLSCYCVALPVYCKDIFKYFIYNSLRERRQWRRRVRMKYNTETWYHQLSSCVCIMSISTAITLLAGNPFNVIKLYNKWKRSGDE